MKTLISAAAKRPVAVTMLTLTLALLGLLAAGSLPVDFLPDLDIPRLTVVTRFTGLPSTEVRELLTIPLEDTLSSAEGLRSMSSLSADGLSIIDLEFHWGTDMAMAGAETRELIDVGFLSLPSDAEKPVVLPVDPSEKPIVVLGLFPRDQVPLARVRRMAEREIRTALQQIRGVGSVQFLGGRREEIHIDVDQEMISARGLSVRTVSSTLSANNIEYPAGSIEQGALEYIVKADGRSGSLQALEALYLPSGEQSIRLRDVATVERGLEKRHSFLFHDGEEGIALLVRRQTGFSPVTLSDNVRRALPELELAFGRDVEIRFLGDESEPIRESVRSLTFSALIGTGMAFAVILFFLRRISLSLILICSIPASILSTLATFSVAGISLNIMSLGGLAIGIGMLVDNSVVVLENLGHAAPGKEIDTVVRAASEVAGSIAGSTFTSLIVFLPLFFLPGLLGDLFGDLAAAVSLSLFYSLLFSLTLVPVLYRAFGKPDPEAGSPGFAKRNPAFRCLFRFLFRNPILYLLLAGLILAGGLVSLRVIDTSWLQSPASDRILLTLRFPAGTSMEYLNVFGRSLHHHLSALPQIAESVVRCGGDPEDPYYVATAKGATEQIEIDIGLTGRFEEAALPPLRARLAPLLDGHGIDWTLSGPENPLLAVLDIHEQTRTFELRRPSREKLDAALANHLARIGKENVDIYPRGDKPHLHLIPDREALSTYRLSLSVLSQFTAGAIHGSGAGIYREEGRDIPIVVRLGEQERNEIEDLQKMLVPLENGKTIRLADAVGIREEMVPSTLYRSGREDAYTLSVPDDAEAAIASLRGAPDVRDLDEEAWSGQIGSIALIAALALLLLYALLGAQFESFFLPLLFLLVLPGSAAGAAAALGVSGYDLNLNALLSILVIVGLSVNNAIILFDHIRSRMPARGRSLFSVYRGTENRLRPVLITFWTTVLALLPVAIELSGDNGQSAMATSIIGGLSATTVISLLLYPWLYYRYFEARRR